jgi:soluble lytic murein transglycosylase-like protein
VAVSRRACGWLLAALAVASASPVGAAEGYLYKTPDGQLEYTDKEKTDPAYTLVRRVDLDDRSRLTIVQQLPPVPHRPIAYQPIGRSFTSASRQTLTWMIERVGSETQVGAELLHAVIRAESGYNSTAVSHAGAAGLMQLMPGTADRYGVRDRFDAAENLRGGATYLRDLMRMFNENLPLVLAGYNAGENAVINHGYKIPPYAETQEYVRRVLQYYAEERLRSGGSSASVLARQ